MADMSDEQVASVLRDAVRVLKPGKVYSFLKFHLNLILEHIINDIRFY